MAELGLGRAHHRVIYFVGRQPDMSVSDLLTILKITKQSLSRVLSHLIDTGYIQQDSGARDKRQRLLALTEKGLDLEKQNLQMFNVKGLLLPLFGQRRNSWMGLESAEQPDG